MNSLRQFRLTSLSLVSFVSLLVAMMPANAVTILPQGSTVAGKTIGEWTADWWKWAFNQSKPSDAFTDMTGANAGVNQSGPVFFVAGTAGGNATRSFTVPGDKYLLIPMVNAAVSEVGDGLTGQDLKEFATFLADNIDSGFLEIDGVSVIDNSNFGNYREASPLFNYMAATDNPFGATVGDSGEAYADGYYVMVQPFGSGTHIFSFGGGASEFGFSVEVEDTITAVPVPEPTSTLGFIALGTLGAASTLKRKLESSKSPEKETV
jgi:hypothetical protein